MTENPPTATRDPEGPTEAQPEVGIVALKVGNESIEISHVEHWVEDSLHIFRSTEFDCVAEAPDEAGAVVVFIETAEDLFRYLDDLVDAGRATDDEVRTLVKLSRRFFEAFEASERRRHSIINLRRSASRPQWQRLTAPDSSSELLPA